MAAAAQNAGGTQIAQQGAAQQGSAQQVMALVTRGRETFAAMPQKKRTKLMMCGITLAAICAAVAWWSGRTDWKTLYSGLEGRDLQQVEGELAAANITYQPTPDGLGVQVPTEMLDKARMEVATKGMPQSGRMGFELFDKPNWVGSEFDEKVNYQRALEGELEHTIATLGAVRSARVHLVLPKDSLFSSEQQPAKASVVLKLKNSTLGRDQIESIRNLVAGAVEGLTPDQVTLVDADGKAKLNSPDRAEEGNEAEQALEAKLVEMLEPLAGRDNVRATVNISYDDGTEERTDEVVDPTQTVALSTQKRDQIAGGTQKPIGIPGTVSNTPAAAPTGSQVANAQAANAGKDALPVYPNAGAQSQSMHEESSTFAVTKHTTHEEEGPGRITRVTAAVLVNDRAITEGAGSNLHTAWKPRTPDEMKRLEQLAQAAVGFSSDRGDQVVIQNISFEANNPEPPPTAAAKVSEEAQTILRTQPELLKTVGAGLAAIMLILFVIRPVTKQTMTLLREHKVEAEHKMALELATKEAAHQKQLAQVTAQKEEEDDTPSAREKRRAAISNEGVLEYLETQFRREPQDSTRLLESWIGK